MSINTKAIKNRINSVKNTNKVTRSMEKISAVKRSRFSSFALESKQYTKELSETNSSFASTIVIDSNSPALLTKRSLDTTLIVALTSDRGLCGSFNANVINVVSDYIREVRNIDPNRIIKLMSLGKKGAKIATVNNVQLDSLYEKMYETKSYEKSVDVSRSIIEKYLIDECDEVILIYTSFQSAQVQNIVIDKILPFKDIISEKNAQGEEYTPAEDPTENDFLLEPSPDKLQEYIFLKTLDTKIYQAILESSASEHSSRMIAMKNASDNASDLRDSLTLTFNKGRQASITQEVSEIVSGIESLSN